MKVLHLESTDVCQLACPLCARETNPKFNKKEHNHLTIEKISKLLSVDSISKLEKMFMCGNYGDPAAGKHTLEIYEYFRNINTGIVLGMNTNAGLQSPDWWYRLACIFNQTYDYVVFSIDGLEDTNHIYRRNINWQKLMENCASFINAGGSAHWDMLVYKHNQHQVYACEQLAKDLGFTWFRAKVSKRPYIAGLEFPSGWTNPIVDRGEIFCMAEQEQSIYIDARGNMHGCCWLGNKLDNTLQVSDVKKTWNTNSPNKICYETCSAKTNSFKSQWQREVQLK